MTRSPGAARMWRAAELGGAGAGDVPEPGSDPAGGPARRAPSGAAAARPHSYRTQARFRLAEALPRNGLAIPMAAAEAGFYNQAHPTRHFMSVAGVTPGQYARTARQI